MAKHLYRNFRRTLRLNFYTSSVDKLLQARLLFSEHGYRLGFFRGSSEPYDEDYSRDTKYLLAKAIATVREEFGLLSPFFIEDTSIRLEALSTDVDVPGMRAKEWFASTSFSELDQELKARGNQRSATVKSDIALHLPNFPEPIFFHGETQGVVADTEPLFDENPAYPWLTPRTFNGWFVPNGQKDALRLGEMAYESSLDFDFRARSLREVIRYYDQLNAVLNLAPANVEGGHRHTHEPAQLSFSLHAATPVLCVIGEKCAGKTTLANLLIKDREAVHIEASALFQEIAGEGGHTFANDDEVLQFLAADGYEAVARRVVERLEDVPNDRIAVVTGLRAPEEIEYLARSVDDLVIVHVATDARLRYERHLKRMRDPGVASFREFVRRDELQKRFGVLRIAGEVADTVITNDGNLFEFSSKVAELAETLLSGALQSHSISDPPSETLRSLKALLDLGGLATCEEIAAQTVKRGLPVRLYNTNRALKATPEFADRVERSKHKLSYAPTDRTGAAVALMERRAPMPPPIG